MLNKLFPLKKKITKESWNNLSICIQIRVPPNSLKLKVLKKLVAHFYKVVIEKVIFLYFLCEILTGQGKLVGKRCNGQAHSPATKKYGWWSTPIHFFADMSRSDINYFLRLPFGERKGGDKQF